MTKFKFFFNYYQIFPLTQNIIIRLIDEAQNLNHNFYFTLNLLTSNTYFSTIVIHGKRQS